MRTIKVSNGLVNGCVKTIFGKEIVEFLAIPYCKAPIDKRRFRKPEHPIFVDGIINRAEFGTCPPQLAFKIFENDNGDEDSWIPKEEQSEDCLYINIWCPLSILESKETHPVFVWIYGGGFVSGSSSLPIYNGAILALQENIIVVNFNYRVGMLGFLCLDDEINGNQGMWDQVMALKWIHKNIEHFQGNKKNVTLGGNSAGGCSVTLHLLIEESWKYFDKIIIESGVCFSNWAFLPKSELKNRSEIIVNKLLKISNSNLRWKSDLEENERSKIISLLETMDFKEFLIDSEIVDGILTFAWVPCVDGVLIKDSPDVLFNAKRFKPCPSIFLNVENEATYFLLLQFHEIVVDEKGLVDKKYFEESLKYYPFYPNLCPLKIQEKIIEKYDVNLQKMSITKIDNILSDLHFVSDSISLANCMSKSSNKVYYLWFKTLPKTSEYPSWVGTMHADELYYLFGYDMLKNNEEVRTSIKTFMKNIGYFLRNGTLSNGLPLYEPETKQFILIENDQWNSAQFTEDQNDKFRFWYKLKKFTKETI